MTRPSGLPIPRTSLVGRDRDLAELDHLLRAGSERLITLTGVGGCGKTRLALEVARQVRDDFPDGVCLVDLTALTDPGRVALHVAGALGTSEAGLASLPNLHLLLVLDNCEHVVDACAALADQLLSTCADMRILATSREPLLIPGERQRRVRPLPRPETGSSFEPTPTALVDCPSVQLFVERASEVAPGFQLTPNNAAAIAQICTLLDGIPLAIELAAAQARVLAPADIARRLDDCIRLLVGANRLAPTRQQTMRASLDWSYALLSPAEQLVFRRVAVLAGNWNLPAAEAIVADNELPQAQVLLCITRLVDKSLVSAIECGGELLYRLVEPVRQYAAQRLAQCGDLEETQARQTRYCLALAQLAEQELTGSNQAEWLRRLESELDDFRSVLSRAERNQDGLTILAIVGPLYYFLWLRGHLCEGRHWLEAGLRCADGASPKVRAKGLFGLMLMLSLVGENDEAEAVGQQAVALFDDLRKSGGRALALVILAQTSLARGDVKRAQRLAQDALAHARSSRGVWPLGHALILLGHVLCKFGETARALELYEQARSEFETRGDAWSLAFALASLASLRQPGCSVASVAGLASVRWARDIRDLPALASALEYLAVYGGPPTVDTRVRLCAAAHATRVSVGISEPVAERDNIERELRQARAQMGEASFQQTWDTAHSVPIELLVAEVLSSPTAGGARVTPGGRGEMLTAREREVALLVVQGASDKQIAQTLTITEGTAGLHVHHVLAKLGLRSRAQVADHALAAGLVKI